MTGLGLLAPRRLGRLVAGDAMNLARDPMLLFATAMSLVPALALHFAQEPLDAAALGAFGIEGITRTIAPVMLLIPAVLIGWVTGFLLLEDRDEGTLLALDVTPVGKTGFLIYRTTVTALLAVALTLYAWPLVMPGQPPHVAIALAIVVGLNAVAFSVALPAIARNKVEGVALSKLTNLFAVVPLLGAVPSPLRYLGGVVPSYWVGELFGLTSVAPAPPWLSLLLALATGAAVIAGLLKLLARRAG